MKTVAIEFDGIRYRQSVALGKPQPDLDNDGTVYGDNICVFYMPNAEISTLQINTLDATVKVALTCASQKAVANLIKAVETGLPANHTASDVYNGLIAAGTKASFIPWALGDCGPLASLIDYFESSVVAVVVYCETGAAPDSAAYVHFTSK
jgi:hypothetical protein